MQVLQPAQSLRYRSPGPHSSGAPNGGESHPPLCPQGQGGLSFWPGISPARAAPGLRVPLSRAERTSTHAQGAEPLPAAAPAATGRSVPAARLRWSLPMNMYIAGTTNNVNSVPIAMPVKMTMPIA